MLCSLEGTRHAFLKTSRTAMHTNDFSLGFLNIFVHVIERGDRDRTLTDGRGFTAWAGGGGFNCEEDRKTRHADLCEIEKFCTRLCEMQNWGEEAIYARGWGRRRGPAPCTDSPPPPINSMETKSLLLFRTFLSVVASGNSGLRFGSEQFQV